ncbi:hypothetical protein RF11_06660 [Thelohanellus kitauei]|uniref:Uncharacterized protein n=1 Tax=Thelohanellus kitauei TaxID=669202 RepID=A0A0C2MPS8_THEKT|nr:hypothetical protein RF11_06660 [Thelohanellus kitauei]
MTAVNPLADGVKPWMIDAKRSIKCSEYNLDILYDSKRARATEYPPSLCVARRGTPVSFRLEAHKLAVDAKHLGLHLITKVKSLEKLIEVTPAKAYKAHFQCKVDERDGKTFLVTLQTTTSAPVGLYSVSVSDGSRSVTEPLPLFIVFNPLDASDEVYADEKSLMDDYLDNPSTRMHYGSAYSHGRRTYKLDQVLLLFRIFNPLKS